jgi:hypothetical protein
LSKATLLVFGVLKIVYIAVLTGNEGCPEAENRPRNIARQGSARVVSYFAFVSWKARGGGGEDVLKKAHIFTGPLLRILVNFRCPPPSF